MSVSLLPNQLSNAKLRVSAAWGADLTADPGTWSFTDITSDVLQDGNSGITISPMGRSNEATVAQPARCVFRLKNQTGTYTPYNPASTNYPNVTLGTPVRVEVSLDGGSTWSTRFQGEAASWTPAWDAQGRKAYVAVTASGITRRLAQGNKPLRSALYRQITKDATAPLAYWSLEEGINTTSFANGVAGGTPLPFVGDAGQLSTIDGPPGSAPLLDHLNLGEYPPAGSDLNFLPITAGSDSFHSLECVAYVQAGSVTTGSADLWMLNWATSGTFGTWHGALAFNGSGVIIYYVDGSGIIQTALSYTAPANLFDSQWHHYRLTFSQSGGNSTIVVYVDGTSVASTVIAMTQGHVTGVMPFVDPNDRGTMTWSTGHLAVYGQAPPDNMPAFRGNAGEAVDDRITRLCAEEGIPLVFIGTSGVPLGVQGVDTLMNLLRECEATDFGYLLDGLGAGLHYTTRAHLYNEAAQLTVDANSGQVPATPGPQPTHDDQRIRNQITVARTNGSTVVAEDTDGTLGTSTIGVFAFQSTVNTETDSVLANMAAWLLHNGTVEGMRYPTVPIDLAASPELASSWVGTVPTNRLDITNLSNRLTQHPVGDVALFIEGWSEFLSARQWNVVTACSLFRPWVVAETDSWPLELAGQTLASNLTTGATSLSLATASGYSLFTTTARFPADFPVDLNVGGWRIRCTAASGSSSPQTLTIDASPNTSTVPSGTAVTLWQPAVLAL